MNIACVIESGSSFSIKLYSVIFYKKMYKREMQIKMDISYGIQDILDETKEVLSICIYSFI